MQGLSKFLTVALLVASSAMSPQSLRQPRPRPRPRPRQAPPTSHVAIHIPSFSGIGVTSCTTASSTTRQSGTGAVTTTVVHVGTKRGKLKKVTWTDADTLNEPPSVEDVHDANAQALKPYPIYSIMHLPGNENSNSSNHCAEEESSGESILCGGGDRYITVWEKQKEPGKQEKQWRIKSQLGPHTGWVKALAYYSYSSRTRTRTLFSIGCNCIEIWTDPEFNNAWQHVRKLQIESCPNMGATLSSDLLCLATTYNDDDYNSDDSDSDSSSHPDPAFLFAGGVDGRIHKWAIHQSFDCRGAVSAHDGRVNEIVVCKNLKVLVSIGNDATVQCRDMTDDDSPFETWAVTTVNLKKETEFMRDEDDDDDDDADADADESSSSSSSSLLRTVSLCVVRGDTKTTTIAVGTTSGVVLLIDMYRSETGGLNAKILKDHVLKLEDGGILHALDCCQVSTNEKGNGNGNYRIIGGHSNGLSVWDISLP